MGRRQLSVGTVREFARRACLFYFRIFLGIIFVMSGLGKIADIKGFAVNVSGYRMLPQLLVAPFSYALSWAEFFCGLFLLSGGWPFAAGIIASGLMVLFITAVTTAYARGLNIDCGCFDIPIFGSSKIGWHTLLRNFIFLLMSATIAFTGKKVNSGQLQ